ncbi:hypothetical protein ES754_02085 [Psychrobacter frigidicola]|uniref:Spore coat protein U/FanG domain-containing protein n=1 Tax=Psychrobacter frigidicola TaxID=45611 RepID=A0A5C7A7V2_9GAMM|nr:spore coat protein U domain-containing protein [Psychrobacter frigidicola]TXD97786.1 hypothetical protein ES754_02085 [Psychrobacter frigidicola]
MTFNKNLLTATLLTFGGFAAMSGANAAVEDTFGITLAVETACNIATGATADIDLGTVNDGSIKTATTSIEVLCSLGTPYQLALTPSSDSDVGIGALQVAGAGTSIDYQLTQTVGSAVWGNIVGTNTLDEIGDGVLAGESHSVTATTTSATDVAPGAYTDTVTVNLTF